jgi:hypothetical protein
MEWLSSKQQHGTHLASFVEIILLKSTKPQSQDDVRIPKEFLKD